MKVKIKKYKIEGKEFTFRPCARGFIGFEKLTGKSIDDCNTLEDVIHMVYTCTQVGMEKENLPFDYTYDQFLDLIDDHLDVIKSLADSKGEKK